MIVPYLPTEKIIKASNGEFIIKEKLDGYELWELNPKTWLVTCPNINDLREEIGEIYKIV